MSTNSEGSAADQRAPTLAEERAHIMRILNEARTIAVVGLSMKEDADSRVVATYLHDAGYRIIPVNPRYAGQKIFGEPFRASLRDVGEVVDVVDVFRRSEGIPPIADDAIAIKPKVFWMQVGISHPEAAERLRAAGIDVVENRCLMTAHRILMRPRGRGPAGD